MHFWPRVGTLIFIFVLADTHVNGLPDYQLIRLSVYIYSMVINFGIAQVHTGPKASDKKAG